MKEPNSGNDGNTGIIGTADHVYSIDPSRDTISTVILYFKKSIDFKRSSMTKSFCTIPLLQEPYSQIAISKKSDK